jgi:hypothetical protein
MARTSDLMQVGDRVWLVPNRPTAPSVAYRRPQVEVVKRNGSRITVRLDDGRELETDVGNLRRTPPPIKELDQVDRKIPVFPKSPPVNLPEGWTEEQLW